MGLDYTRIPGDGFKEKRRSIMALSQEGMAKMISDCNGFAIEISEGADGIYVIPTGFMICTASSGCISMRLAVASDDSDLERVKCMLSELTAAFADMRCANTGIPQFQQFVHD